MSNNERPDGNDDFLRGISETETLLLPTNLSLASPTPLGESNHRRSKSDLSFFNTNTKPKHHRRQSSISDLAETLGTNVRAAASEIRRTFVEEMENADSGRVVFLETGMMRNLSVLPEDLECIYDDFRLEEVFDKDPSFQQDQPLLSDTETGESKTSTPSVNIGAYLSLFVAVFAISSNGTSLNIEKGASSALKLYWRMSATWMFLSPFAIPMFCRQGLPKLDFGQWAILFLAVVCYASQNLLFIMSLSYTTIGNACIFANSQAVILLAGKAFVGTPIHWMEAVGAAVAIGGAVLCATDTERDTNGTSPDDVSAIVGDGLALLSAVMGVLYITAAKAVRPLTSAMAFIFIMMLTGSFLMLGYLTIVEGNISINMDPHFGTFGWMVPRADRLLVETWIVLVCNVVGTMGFVRSMQYFDSIVIAVSTLMEPMLASLIAAAAHVGVMPGIKGWMGNVLVILGTFGVVYPSASKKGSTASH